MRFRRGQDRRRLLLLEENQLLAYLLNDEFSIDDSAPLTGSIPADIAGTWTGVDTGSNAAINGGVMTISAQATAWVDPRLYYGTFTRSAGVAVYVKIANIADGQAVIAGIATSNSPADTGSVAGLGLRATEQIRPADNLSLSLGATPASAEFVTVLKSTGAYEFSYDGTDWTLVWPRYTDSTASLYLVLVGANAGAKSFDIARIVESLSAFADSSFITDSLSGSLAAGQTFTHEADTWVTWDFDTLQSSSSTTMECRKVDDNNTWRVVVNSDGSANIVERVSGGNTTRATAGAGTFAGGEKVRALFNGANITVYADNTQIMSYGGASNFQTATAGEVKNIGTGGALSDLETLPRTASGTHLTQLQAIAAGS